MAVPSIINPVEQNRPAAQVKLEQEEEVYNKLYVRIVDDFIHKDDFNAWKEKFEKQLESQNLAIQELTTKLKVAFAMIDMHGHSAFGTPSGVVTQTSISYTGKSASQKLNDQIAKSYIDHSGVSGFDSTIEKRKKSQTKLKPPLSAESL